MAILSMMARLGSSDPVDLRDSHDALIEGFDISRFGAAPTKFGVEDLLPLTARVVQGLGAGDVAGQLDAAGVPAVDQEAYWIAVRGNVGTRADAGNWWPVFAGNATPIVAPEDRDFVNAALALLGEPPYGPETWAAWTEAVKAQTGRKGRNLYMPLRLAVTGQPSGPEMAEVMPLLQKRPAPG